MSIKNTTCIAVYPIFFANFAQNFISYQEKEDLLSIYQELQSLDC